MDTGISIISQDATFKNPQWMIIMNTGRFVPSNIEPPTDLPGLRRHQANRYFSCTDNPTV